MEIETGAALAEIAAELYSAPPADFTTARNSRAAEIGDHDLATQVRALRKPSIAAWAVNVFARERASELGEALQLAEELREAQADLDAPTLAALGRQRRALTGRLAERAAELATARGAQISASTLDAIRQTITAAFFDPDAARAAASGRLIRELEPSSPIDLDASVAGGLSDSPPAPPVPVDEVRARRERRQAEQAVRTAERELASAERDQGKADRDVRDTARRAAQLSAQAAELEAELARVRAQIEIAGAEMVRAEEHQGIVQERLASAERAIEDARKALDHL
ncbi:transposase [Microbacterium sp. LTA6]|uniref:transposase n=1 Tax=Microbacterium sp. LTA6 TaxID=3129771 RepID=UPI0032530889